MYIPLQVHVAEEYACTVEFYGIHAHVSPAGQLSCFVNLAACLSGSYCLALTCHTGHVHIERYNVLCIQSFLFLYNVFLTAFVVVSH